MNIKIDIPDSFFAEETKYDYLISNKMKKVWAIELDLLKQLEEICDKYNLCYYADSGTLIGAVRHKGFIPWDDDIDIVMKRKDFDKLIEVGEKEFKHPYFLQSGYSEVFPRGYMRLRNSDSTAITKRDYKNKINHGVFIDIFPLDNLPDDTLKRKKWCNQIKYFESLLNIGAYKSLLDCHTLFETIKFFFCKSVYNIVGYKKLFEKYNKLCSKYNNTNTLELSYVSYSKGKAKHIWKSKWFENRKEVQFEFMKIFIPEGYDERLKVEYGDYMKIVHANTAHGDLILEPDISYKKYLEDHNDVEIAEILNIV